MVVTVTINTCEEPVTVTVKIEVPDDDLSWSNTFASGKQVAVPGFSVNTSAGVYVGVDMKPDDDDVLVLNVTPATAAAVVVVVVGCCCC